MKTQTKLIAVAVASIGYIAYQRSENNNLTNAKNLLKKWMSNVNLHDKKAVLSLYSQDAVLLPTLYNVSSVGYNADYVNLMQINPNSFIAQGKTKIGLYMDAFLILPDLKGTLYEESLIFKKMGMNTFSVDGVYSFYYTDPESGSESGDNRTQFARFTFIYKREPFTNNWLITNQNSNKGYLYFGETFKN